MELTIADWFAAVSRLGVTCLLLLVQGSSPLWFQVPNPPSSDWEKIGIITVLVLGYAIVGGLLISGKMRIGNQVDRENAELVKRVADRDEIIARLLKERDTAQDKREKDLERFERMTDVLEQATDLAKEIGRTRSRPDDEHRIPEQRRRSSGQ